ncbi:MAG TPA: DUF2845 domain-containing protein [Steroidobacteraceae bacterium]|nr:DUF2845 domain-containing protein [Steroidobacteraceae bacterium]
MQYRRSRAGLAAALCLIAAQHAWGDTMRCGNKLVSVGDSMAAVQALCGAPAAVQHGAKATASGSTEVPVETWTYNRGPNQLLVNIRFVNGQVVAITTLHQYGN